MSSENVIIAGYEFCRVWSEVMSSGGKWVLVTVLVTWTTNQVLVVLLVQNDNFWQDQHKCKLFECGVRLQCLVVVVI